MTYREATEKLKQAGIADAEWDAALLIAHFCGTDRARILAEPERYYDSDALRDAVRARSGRFPLQYLIGEWTFWKQTYEVTPDCLIPRPDTEILVEQAVAELPENAFFADLCTGSGCIAVSTLCERPDTTALAVDLSRAAIGIAIRNAEENGVSERFTPLVADVLTNGWTSGFPRPAAILSNPPYIRSAELAALAPEIGAEPEMALDGGADGLRFYRGLVRLARDWLAPDGVCLFEIGFDQADDLRRIASENGFSCGIVRDLGGNDRVVRLRRTKTGKDA